MKIPLTILMTILPMLLAGCSSTNDKVQIPLDSDPRVGEAVDQVCFTRSLDSWQNVDNDRNALVLKMNNRDHYKLKLSGACDPDLAISTIAVITRSSSACFSRGDRLKTDADMSQGYGSACIILGINKWNPEAANQTDETTESQK